jgi:hypothetical protein
MSRRQNILSELMVRLGRINTSNGFQTAAGDLLFIGERPVLGPSDPAQSIAVSVKPDIPGYQGENIAMELPVAIAAIVRADTDQAWASIEAIIADIKEAVEIDHDFGGLLDPRGLERGTTEPYDRESGDTVVGATVNYTFRYREQWGAP